MSKPTYAVLSQLVTARLNCIKSNNEEWLPKHTAEIHRICEDNLPSGSGIDRGTKIDLDASTPDKIVLLMSYHHMDEAGGYDGWTEHEVIVTPSLAFGFDLRITGRDRNGIKEYLRDTYSGDLAALISPR